MDEDDEDGKFVEAMMKSVIEGKPMRLATDEITGFVVACTLLFSRGS